MQDLHLELVRLLQEKEEATDYSSLNTVRDDLKRAGYRLHQGGEPIDAAFAYYVAGYYVRAYRIVSSDKYDDNTLSPAQCWLRLFIQKRFQLLANHLATTCMNDDYQDETIAYLVSHQGLSDHEAISRVLARGLAETLIQFMSFVQEGDSTALRATVPAITKCQQLACKARMYQWWWWIECIRHVVEEFRTNCLWTCLQTMRNEDDNIVSKYIMANYNRRDPVVELWRTQTESLPLINDPHRQSFCVSVPTSSGKTRIAELAILRCLMDYRDTPTIKCIYIAPFRRLAAEVEECLRPALSEAMSDPYLVSCFYGGREIDLVELEGLSESRVLIVTPERLDTMLRREPELLQQIKLVIADEGHMIGEDDSRGYKYRMLLERLVYSFQNRPKQAEQDVARLLLISGVLPNGCDLARFVSGDDSNIVQIYWKPVDEPLVGTWEWDRNGFKSTHASVPLPTILSVPQCQSPDDFQRAVVYASYSHAISHRTFVFSASKRALESDSLIDLLVCLSTSQPLLPAPPQKQIPLLPPMSRHRHLLERGVAIHHAGLSSALRRETEERVYDGRVKLLFASPTLGHGVNIPFDSVLIYRLYHFQNKPISDSEFWNVVGRVGRPRTDLGASTNAIEQPLVIFLTDQSKEKEASQERKTAKRVQQSAGRYRIASPFICFLIELGQLWREETNESIASLLISLSEIPDLGWIKNPRTRSRLSESLHLLDEHLVALAEESAISRGAEDWLQARVADVVDLLLQATPISSNEFGYIRDAIRARTSYIAQHVSAHARRQTYLLGLPLDDCDAIAAKQDELLTLYQGCERIFSRHFEEGLEYLCQILRIISGLSICPKKWHLDKLSSGPLFGWNIESVWQGWIMGRREEEFAHMLIPRETKRKTKSNTEREAKPGFDDYREEMLESRLVWGLSAIYTSLKELAQNRGAAMALDLEYLPSLVKYGVPSKLACHLVRIGIPRAPAAQIAEHYSTRLEEENANLEESMFVPDLPLHQHARHAIQQALRQGLDQPSFTSEEIRIINSIAQRFN